MRADELDLNYRPQVVIPDIEAITHEEWLRSRMNGIGGSDAGAILGVNKYTSAYQIGLKKLGFDDREEITPESQYTLDFGHAMEPLVLKLYQQKTGFEVFTDRAQYCHPFFPFMLGDCDGMARTPDGDLIGLEIKTYNYQLRDRWRSGIYGKDGIIKNPEYAIQVAHYMSVLNLDRFDLLAIPGNNADDLVVITFYRDLDREAEIITAEKEFWEGLQKGILPRPTTLRKEAYQKIVEALSDEAETSCIELDASLRPQLDEIASLEAEKAGMSESLKKLEERLNALKVPIVEALDSHETATCGDYRITFKGTSRTGIDQKKLRIAFPEVYEQVRTVSNTVPAMKIRKAIK